jgi:hypothetical protein
MKRAFAAALVFALAQGVVGAQADGFGALRFLFGNWQAIDLPAGESGGFTFKLGVQDHVVIRTNEAHYPAAGDRPASNHDDLLVIYREDGSLKADYFDSEGHVIRYVVDTPSTNVATFVSTRSAGQPRYRLTLTTPTRAASSSDRSRSRRRTPPTRSSHISPGKRGGLADNLTRSRSA